MRSTTVVFNLSIFAGILAGYLWLPPTVSAENSFSQTTLDSSKINTPKIQGVPDFTALMASEGNKVVHISAMQKSVPKALSPMDLFKKLLPPEDDDEKNEPPPDLLKRKEKQQVATIVSLLQKCLKKNSISIWVVTTRFLISKK